jgi:hypothetical protein
MIENFEPQLVVCRGYSKRSGNLLPKGRRIGGRLLIQNPPALQEQPSHTSQCSVQEVRLRAYFAEIGLAHLRACRYMRAATRVHY